VRTFPDPEQDVEWGDADSVEVKVGDTFFINDYVATFKSVERLSEIDGIQLVDQDVAVKASIEIQGEYDNYLAEPIYIIRDRMAGKIPTTINDLAARVSINSINPERNSFTFEVYTTQKDWIIMEAVEKPWINILWTGTLLLTIGFTVAIVRRYQEFTNFRNKGLES
jgi:cytochrome c-type biogenesis protein CcmF